MTKVIEQEILGKLEIDVFNHSIFVSYKYRNSDKEECIEIEHSAAREVALAIFDFEKEKIEFAKDFLDWTQHGDRYVKEGSGMRNTLCDLETDETMNLYLKQKQ